MVAATEKWQCTVPVSGHILMITFVLPNFNYKLMYYWHKHCMEIYNYRKVIPEF